jgi:hypothetical protein
MKRIMKKMTVEERESRNRIVSWIVIFDNTPIS